MSSIYISGLPLDVTYDELVEHFGQIGIIADDKKARGKKKVKIYTDDDGTII